jgi:hypothetical protein
VLSFPATASDPTKARRYRVVARALAAAVAAGDIARDDARLLAAYDQLIKLPEHTYGSNDGLVANQPWNNSWLDAHIANDSSFERTESGWADQRKYIGRAVAALADAQPLRAQIEAALAASEPAPVDVAPLEPWPLTGRGGAPQGTVACGGVTIGFDGHGAISTLSTASREWANATSTLARFRYVTHSEPEFNAWGSRYMLPGCRNDTAANLCGFGKAGLTTQAGAEHKDWAPTVTGAWKSSAASAAASATCKMVVALSFPAEAQGKYGAPSIANITVTVGAGVNNNSNSNISTAGAAHHEIGLDVQYHKRHTRMAESLWLSFAPASIGSSAVSSPHGWRLDKLGLEIDPFDVVVNGSRHMHGVWDGLKYYEPPPPSGHRRHPQGTSTAAAGAAGAPALSISSPDAPLVAADVPSPIVFMRDEQIAGRSWHFNFFNNAWNTNYPLWEVNMDERFRFTMLVGA